MHISNRWAFLSIEPREHRDESGEHTLVRPMLIGVGIKPFSLYLVRFRRVCRRTQLDDGALRDHFRTSRIELWVNATRDHGRHVDLIIHRGRYPWSWRPTLRHA
jgi:hypothetical protein